MKKAIKKDKKFIRDGFDGIADKYDFFNNFITFSTPQNQKRTRQKHYTKNFYPYRALSDIRYLLRHWRYSYQLKNFAPKNFVKL